MKTVICIPLHPSGGKFKDNSELRYALRSIEKNFTDDFEIAIVSKSLPDWIQGVKHIYGEGLKSSLWKAAEAFPEGFFWWYDDNCLLIPTDAETMKVTPVANGWSKPVTEWRKQLEKVRKRLTEEGYAALDYSSPHGPYWFDLEMVKEGFADWEKISGKFPWETWILSKRGWPHTKGGTRQYYGEFKVAPGTEHRYLNYNDKGVTSELTSFLNFRFPKASRFEKAPVIEMKPVKKHAISYSLFGEEAIYSVGLLENVTLAAKYYPEAEVVAHVERGHYGIQRLKQEGVRVIEHERKDAWSGLLWRFETGLESDRYTVVHFRDADSRLGPREAAAVNEWLATANQVHVMSDHPDHKNPVNAGMWSIRTGGGIVTDALGRALDRPLTNRYGDETALREEFWSVTREMSLRHSGNESPQHGASFPKHDLWDSFVGKKVQPTMKNTRFVVLSPEIYEDRRSRFYSRLQHSEGILGMKDCEWWKATPSDRMLCPPSFTRLGSHRHWWAATRDHVRILEETLLDDTVEYLLLCEDDAMFSADFDEYFWRAFAGVPADWRALWLGRHDRYYFPKPVNKAVERCSHKGQGQSCVFWNRKGMLRFYDHLWHRCSKTIDDAFEDLRNYDPTGWYQPTKKIVIDDPDARQKGRS